MSMDRRQRALNAQDIKSEVVCVVAWGIDIEVRGLTGRQRTEVVSAAREEDGTVNESRLLVPMVIAASYDPDTKQPMFSVGDSDLLSEKSFAALDQITSVAIRLSGLSRTEIENIRGNSNGTPSAASFST